MSRLVVEKSETVVQRERIGYLIGTVSFLFTECRFCFEETKLTISDAPKSEETEMDAMESELAVHDENGDEGLDVEKSIFKRDQHSRSHNAKKRDVIYVPMV